MDVIGEMKKVRMAFYNFEFVLSLKKRAHALIFFIKVLGIASADFLHKKGNAIFHFLPHHKMEVIRHQAERHKFHKELPGFPFNLRQSDCLRLAGAVEVIGEVDGERSVIKFKEVMNKAKVVCVVEKHRSLFDASVVDMVNVPR